MAGPVIQLLGSIGATVTLYGIYKIFKFFYRQWTSPLRDLPGPKGKGFIWGNMKEIFEAVCMIRVTVIMFANTISMVG